jgi:hypothetical protein
MTSHCCGVTKCEIDVLVTVNIRDDVSFCALHVKREATNPLIHPRHWNATK